MQLSLAGQIHNLTPFSIRCRHIPSVEGFKNLAYEIRLGHARLISDSELDFESTYTKLYDLYSASLSFAHALIYG